MHRAGVPHVYVAIGAVQTLVRRHLGFDKPSL